jgi:hypothetical protein
MFSLIVSLHIGVVDLYCKDTDPISKYLLFAEISRDSKKFSKTFLISKKYKNMFYGYAYG